MNAEHKRTSVNAAIEKNIALKGALLPILHQIQNALDHIPSEHVTDIASALNLSRAEVYGVISFYHSFTTSPSGKHVIEICCAESCQATGSREIESALKNKLGIGYQQTTKDGEFTLQAVYCLGNCACSPSIKIDTQMHSRLTGQSALELIEELKRGES